MTLQEVKQALAHGGRVAARYRDKYGFITSGVILCIKKDEIFIDSLLNSVKIDAVVSIKHI